MPLRNLSPKLTDEARDAIAAALDAMGDCHREIAASSDRLVEKMAGAARALGWPDPIVTGITTQIQSITKMQIQMLGHIMEACQAQVNSQNPMEKFPSQLVASLQSWPGLQPPGQWPGAEAFNVMAADPVQFWVRLGEQWQKNWAQMMSQWGKPVS